MIKRLSILIILFLALCFIRQPIQAQDYDYVIPDSSRSTLTRDDFSSLSPWELKVARNEIYARHGRPFKSADLRCYFKSKGWYRVNPRYSDRLLTKTENKNIQIILNYEKSIGSKVSTRDMGCSYSKSSQNSYSDPPEQASYSGGDYILSFSNSRTVTNNDLAGLSPWELKVARNEIYARHGRPFKSADLRCYFQNKGWYSENPGYSDRLLNGYEQKNAVKILNYEKQRGSKIITKDMGCGYGSP